MVPPYPIIVAIPSLSLPQPPLASPTPWTTSPTPCYHLKDRPVPPPHRTRPPLVLPHRSTAYISSTGSFMTLTLDRAPSSGQDLPSSCSPRPATTTVPPSFSPGGTLPSATSPSMAGRRRPPFKRSPAGSPSPRPAARLSRHEQRVSPPERQPVAPFRCQGLPLARSHSAPLLVCPLRPPWLSDAAPVGPTLHRHLLLWKSHRDPLAAFLRHPPRFFAAAPAKRSIQRVPPNHRLPIRLPIARIRPRLGSR